MSQKGLHSGKIKNRNKLKGVPAERKAQRRAEAEERNAVYQALPIEEKLKRHKEGGKVWKKLMNQERSK